MNLTTEQQRMADAIRATIRRAALPATTKARIGSMLARGMGLSQDWTFQRLPKGGPLPSLFLHPITIRDETVLGKALSGCHPARISSTQPVSAAYQPPY